MLTIRIRSSNGTKRLTVDEHDLVSTLSQRIRTDFSGELQSRGFKLWREGDPAKHDLLSGVDGGRSFQELGLRQGEMLYLALTEKTTSPVHVQDVKEVVPPPTSQGAESFPLGHASIYRRIRELLL